MSIKLTSQGLDGVKPRPLEKNEQGRNCNGKWRLSPDNQEVSLSGEGGDSIAPHKHTFWVPTRDAYIIQL